MKYKYLLIIFALSVCANANADWFLRGTHNAWAADPMELVDANRVQLKGVVFSSAGNIKFDRFGDWAENYGVNGLSGNNIPVASGTWDIQFFTDTKKWTITASQTSTDYHIRGTFNAWIEGTLMSRIGTTDNYESCINFVGSDANGSPRFKIDPNGAWGDALPAADFVVAAGWVKVNFNSTSKAISVQQNLVPNCEAAVASSSKTLSSAAVSSSSPKAISSSLSKSSVPNSSAASSLASSNGVIETYYHIRGTFNVWLEGTLMTRIGTSDIYERCVNFTGGDSNGGPRFKIDPNGAWGDTLPAGADFVVSAGWVKITFNSATKAISAQQNLSANCSAVSSTAAVSSASSSVIPATPYHVRGTFNAWMEGTLMNRIGSSDNYERCVLFGSGENLGIPRFKIDPNGAWGDALPATDFLVSAGWVKISFNSSSKMISVQQNLAANCAPASSTAASSSLSSSTANSSIAAATSYHVRGTFNAWLEGTLMTRIGNTNNYEYCANFSGGGDNNGGPRFKIDPNGAWGDAIPTGADFVVSAGWVKITLNSSTKAISVQQNLSANCGTGGGGSSASSSSVFDYNTATFHLRGNFNDWREGTLLKNLPFRWWIYDACVFIDKKPTLFKVDPNGGWGADVLEMNSQSDLLEGWTIFSYYILDGYVSMETRMPVNCGRSSSSSSAGPIPPTRPFIPLHVRGTHNAWGEGVLMTQMAQSDSYEICLNFTAGDANGGPRFRIDPYGAWGETFPASDSNVPLGWVKIGFNSSTNQITRMTHLLPDCKPTLYNLEGTHHMESYQWSLGDYFEYIDGSDPHWQACRDFGTAGDELGGPRFAISLNHTSISAQYSKDAIPTSGWTFISFTDPKNPTVIKNMGPNCTTP